MTTKLDDISQAIGALQAEVAGLRRDFQQSETRAVDHRAGVHRRMDDIVDEVGDLKSDVAVVKKDVAEMKPVTDDVKRWKLMGMGALAVVGIGGTALGVSIASSLEWVGKLLHR